MEVNHLKYCIELKDKRNQVVYQTLLDKNFNVEEFDFNNTKLEEKDWVIFSPARKLGYEEANSFPNNITIVGGNFSVEVKEILKEKNIHFINLLQNEKFVIQNANLTAEGVLSLLIKETEYSMFKNKILIIGTGKVGTSIAVLFKQNNLDFSFLTFHENKLPYAYYFTNKVYMDNSLIDIISSFDVIINTAPDKVISDSMLSHIQNNAIILEVASTNCLNKDLVNNYSFRYLLCPALPQVFSAKSAGEVMSESVLKNIN